ncbi:hypothetical protein K435DRAFT_157296 [Dendrothele bispora CBS 962.96]|uniref:Zinc finger PHD-type domain-containing protein n=1 Tax=Dendrothele bispora (strain CBS 962.96) TaxID=1314807 RepID=A0A4S8LZ50_DENBC|nr:hypothetical protein K435DRAFT_157296 [Dendrothele bispora CBS 962.96]
MNPALDRYPLNDAVDWTTNLEDAEDPSKFLFFPFSANTLKLDSRYHYPGPSSSFTNRASSSSSRSSSSNPSNNSDTPATVVASNTHLSRSASASRSLFGTSPNSRSPSPVMPAPIAAGTTKKTTTFRPYKPELKLKKHGLFPSPDPSLVIPVDEGQDDDETEQDTLERTMDQMVPSSRTPSPMLDTNPVENEDLSSGPTFSDRVGQAHGQGDRDGDDRGSDTMQPCTQSQPTMSTQRSVGDEEELLSVEEMVLSSGAPLSSPVDSHGTGGATDMDNHVEGSEDGSEGKARNEISNLERPPETENRDRDRETDRGTEQEPKPDLAVDVIDILSDLSSLSDDDSAPLPVKRRMSSPAFTLQGEREGWSAGQRWEEGLSVKKRKLSEPGLSRGEGGKGRGRNRSGPAGTKTPSSSVGRASSASTIAAIKREPGTSTSQQGETSVAAGGSSSASNGKKKERPRRSQGRKVSTPPLPGRGPKPKIKQDGGGGGTRIVWPKMVPGTRACDMILCDSCNLWYHYGCVGFKTNDPRVRTNESWSCPRCVAKKPLYRPILTKNEQCSRPHCKIKDEQVYFVSRLIGRRTKVTGGIGKEYLYLIRWAEWVLSWSFDCYSD